jgi:hypothetical protein
MYTPALDCILIISRNPYPKVDFTFWIQIKIFRTILMPGPDTKIIYGYFQESTI